MRPSVDDTAVPTSSPAELVTGIAARNTAQVERVVDE